VFSSPTDDQATTLLAPAAGGVSLFPGEVAPLDGSADPFALLSATEAALYAGVTAGAVCNWRRRGHLPAATDAQGREIRDSHGRPKYRLADVARAELATSKRARRAA